MSLQNARKFIGRRFLIGRKALWKDDDHLLTTPCRCTHSAPSPRWSGLFRGDLQRQGVTSIDHGNDKVAHNGRRAGKNTDLDPGKRNAASDQAKRGR